MKRPEGKLSYDAALERVVALLGRFGELHLILACHAAFPMVLTPDLLYRLWATFVPHAPWTAVSDILLSKLCNEVGYELYEMDASVRSLLLSELENDVRFGRHRLDALADFLLNDVTQQLYSSDPDKYNLAQAHRWTALAYTQPAQAALELLSVLRRIDQGDLAESIRMTLLVQTFAEQLAEFLPPLVYTRGTAGFHLAVREHSDEASTIIKDIVDEGTPEWVTKYFSVEERDLVRRAYSQAVLAHDSQTRASGEPYVVHCVEVARMLAELGLDHHVVAAGLLHDVVEDTGRTVEDIRKAFGEEVAKLVEGVSQLAYLDTMSKIGFRDAEDADAEGLRRMFLTMADDVRVVLIKLVDRLHNMRSLGSLPADRRERIARETLEIYAPLAARLGIWQIESELEDLGLRYYDPDTYHHIASLVGESLEIRNEYMQRAISELQHRLEKEGVDAIVHGRPKHIYRIYEEMRRNGVEFEKAYRIGGISVTAGSVADCYAALGILHSLWKSIPGEFTDFIATPEKNRYQLLYTVVAGPDGKLVEVQIWTQEMQQAKLQNAAKRDPAYESKVSWIRSLIGSRSDVEEVQRLENGLKASVIENRVYVFTPKGQVLDLPAGSTPIDFAYYLHTEMGHRCRGARVNGRPEPLTYNLQSGDQVEIITAEKGGPRRDWLRPDLGYVRSARSRQKIRRWFLEQDREENIALGREQLRRELKRLNISQRIRYQEVAALFDYKNLDDFFAAIGFGDISSQRVAAKILQELGLGEDFAEEEEVPYAVTPEGIRVKGVGDLHVQLAQCCKPSPDDPSPIIGYVTRGKGITIHKWDCPNIVARTNKGEVERLIEVDWGIAEERIYPVVIRVKARDRDGLLQDVAAVVAQEGVNLSKIQGVSAQKTNLVTLTATLTISSFNQLITILDRIERLPDVIEVSRAAE